MKLRTILLTLSVFSFFIVNASNYYWVGGSGSWSDYGRHWATSTGGSTFYTQVPQSTDNVFFDANSFTATGQAVIIDQPIVQCANMDWTGVARNPSFGGDYDNILKIYGSLKLSAAMSFDFQGPVSFEATSAGKSITTNGKILNTSITFNGIGGSWTLSDALTANWIYLNNGTLNTNNQTVNAFAFTSITSTARALNAGTSTFNLSFYGPMWNINPTGMTMNASSSTINGVATSGGAQDFYGGGFTYNNIHFTGTQAGKINGNSIINDVAFAADGYIQGNCVFNNVSFAADAYLMSNSTFNTVTLAKNGQFTSSNVFNNLTLSPGYSYSLSAGETQTITGILNATGNCGALIELISSSPGNSTTINKTSGSIYASYISMRDIAAIGGASFTANNIIDLGNNTGWTINALPSKTLYWVGNGGNWSDASHWSLTSGGASAGCSPTPMDNVFFDANSFTTYGQTVAIDVPVATVKNMTWTGVAHQPTFYGDYNNSFKIFGSLTLSNNIIFDFTGNLSFEGTSAGNTITTAGNMINTSISFNGVGGSWTLQDELTCAFWIYLNNGTFNTNNKNINAYSLSSLTNTARTLNLGASTINLSFNGAIWTINPANMTVNAGTSKLIGNGFTGGEQYFIGGGFTYNDLSFIGAALGKVIDSNTMHNVWFGADGFIQGGTFNDIVFNADATLYYTNNCNNISIAHNATVYGSNTFNTLTLAAGHTYTLAAGETQTIVSSLTASGSCGGLVEIISDTPGTQTNISKANGTVALSFVTLRDINATGGANFIANSANDLGNNTGWTTGTAVTAKNLYWVGNGGNWDDGNHWSYTSGGVAAGCSPTPIDNAFFDANSFTIPSQVVTVNVPTASVNNMNWTGASNNPRFLGDYSNTLNIYGSLTLTSGVILDFTGPISFEATTSGKTITTAGITFNTSLTFNGIGGSWTLQDNLNCNYWIYLNNGTLNTNNKTVNAYAFNSITSNTRALNLGSSTFNLSFNGTIWNINNTGMTLNAGTSIINGVGMSGGQQDLYGGGFTYNNINFTGLALGKIVDNTNTINDVSFSADGFIQGGTFHNITFAGNATMYYTNICNNVSIAKNADILGSNSFFFLKLSPGYTYTLSAGETQTILAGGNICAEGTGSLPIRIQSSDDGVPTNIYKPDGTICWNYVRLSDINATGAAVFNAGLAPLNSQDMGGNTGFLYTGGCFPLGCAPCVAPAITSQPSDINICNGINTPVSFGISATGSALSYQWQVLQGSTYVNLSNMAPYSGVNSNTLSIASPVGLNGSKYRCTINGACGNTLVSNATTLTINALPVVTTSVAQTTVTVSATGGTAPYTGTGTFTGLGAGTYTYTVVDSKGCSSSATATVVVSNTDNIPPVAICKNTTVTLSNGTASITANSVNNGSYDNVGITSITVNPNTFTCANIGSNQVTLTVKDAKGNTSTCHSTVTVIGSVPTVTITQSNLPDFWQGGAVVLTANCNTGISYLWNSGETTPSKNVTSSGSSSVTVTNSYGCSATKSYSVNYNGQALLSSYTLIAKEDIDLESSSYVQSGGVGVLKYNGDITLKSNSKITGTGTFASAKYISLASGTVVTQKIYVPAAVSLPVYRLNQYCESTSNDEDNDWHDSNCNNHNSWYHYGTCSWGNNNDNDDDNDNHHNSCNNGNYNSYWNNNSHGNNCGNNGNNNRYNCNQSSKKKNVGNNTVVTLSDSIYSDITIGNNCVVTFSQPMVYIKSITTGSNTTINFTGCTELKICGNVVFGNYNVFNSSAKGVVMYSDEEVEINKGSSFICSIYTLKDLQTEGASNARITMKGMFIANKVKSDYTTWNWNNSNTGCTFTRMIAVEGSETSNIGISSEIFEMDVNVFPNPSTDNFSIVLNSQSIAPYSIVVYDMTGKLAYKAINLNAIDVHSFGADLQKGIYLITLEQANQRKSVRAVKVQ